MLRWPGLLRDTRVSRRQANLKHPNIVRVQDILDADSSLAIFMEYVDGPSLEQVISSERSGPWSVYEAMGVMDPVLKGMSYAHERQVVHRDLRPGNILFDRYIGESALGTVQIADFGLAKILSSEAGLTKTGAKMGTVPHGARTIRRQTGDRRANRRVRSCDGSLAAASRSTACGSRRHAFCSAPLLGGGVTAADLKRQQRRTKAV